jgi:hypothetical protein
MIKNTLAILFITLIYGNILNAEETTWVNYTTPKQLLEEGYKVMGVTQDPGFTVYHFILEENIVSCKFELEQNGGLTECYNISKNQ